MTVVMFALLVAVFEISAFETCMTLTLALFQIFPFVCDSVLSFGVTTH